MHRSPPLEVLAHRIFWAAIFLLLLTECRRQRPALWALLRNPRLLLQLSLCTLLIAVNWLAFIYAVTNGLVLQSSLGYFISPLVSALLGFTVLKERLRTVQACSLVLAALGVTYLTLLQGEPPWISLVLAFSFGIYGLLRKQAGVGPTIGLTLETLLLAPCALLYLLLLKSDDVLMFGTGSGIDLWLPCAGVITAIPLIWFNAAAKRLRLVTIGFLQYITPSLHFLLAVFLFNEPFDGSRLVGFALVWSGLLLYTLNALHRSRSRGEAPQT